MASEAARALSRLAFQHSITFLPGGLAAPMCGTTMTGRPVANATLSGRLAGVPTSLSGVAWPTTSRSA
jgi:hypothetical protein